MISIARTLGAPTSVPAGKLADLAVAVIAHTHPVQRLGNRVLEHLIAHLVGQRVVIGIDHVGAGERLVRALLVFLVVVAGEGSTLDRTTLEFVGELLQNEHPGVHIRHGFFPG